MVDYETLSIPVARPQEPENLRMLPLRVGRPLRVVHFPVHVGRAQVEASIRLYKDLVPRHSNDLLMKTNVEL